MGEEALLLSLGLVASPSGMNSATARGGEAAAEAAAAAACLDERAGDCPGGELCKPVWCGMPWGMMGDVSTSAPNTASLCGIGGGSPRSAEVR